MSPFKTGFYGGGGQCAANVVWGPNFGEDQELEVGVSVTLGGAVQLESQLTVGVNIAFSVGLLGSLTVGTHVTGSVLGAPFWQSVATATSATGSITITKPAGTVDGDLLLALIACDTILSNQDIDTPAGWALIRHDTISNQHARSFWKIASGEPADYTFTFTAAPNVSTGSIHRINATDAITPINAHAGGTLAAAMLDPDPDVTSVTTTVPNCLVLAWNSHDHALLSQTHTPGPSHIERADFQHITASIVLGSHAQTRVFAAAGATGTIVSDCTEATATDACLQRIAIAPGSFIIAT